MVQGFISCGLLLDGMALALVIDQFHLQLTVHASFFWMEQCSLVISFVFTTSVWTCNLLFCLKGFSKQKSQ